MTLIPFETTPGTAEWDLPISHDDYTKMMKGHRPRDMDDKIFIKSEAPDAQEGIATFHIYHGWISREIARLEIAPGDPDNTEAKEWATIVKIWWKKDYPYEEPMTEAQAKRAVIRTCNNMLKCEIEYDDGYVSVSESEEDEDSDSDSDSDKGVNK